MTNTINPQDDEYLALPMLFEYNRDERTLVVTYSDNTRHRYYNIPPTSAFLNDAYLKRRNKLWLDARHNFFWEDITNG